MAEPLDFTGVDAGRPTPGRIIWAAARALSNGCKSSATWLTARSPEPENPVDHGSAGGARPHVDATLEVLREIAAEKKLRFMVAVVYSDLDVGQLRQWAAQGRLTPCGGAPEFDPACLDQLVHPVAQFGTEPIIRALQSGADVILSGRCCDTAIFAAYPIMHGFPAGLALHAAKIAECGALCARPVGANDSLVVTLRHDAMTVRPPNPIRTCTPDSVAAHSLYEQPDPSASLSRKA